MSETAPAQVSSPSRPWSWPLRILSALASVALIAYAGFCMYLFAMQTRMIYVGCNAVLPTDQAIQQAKSAGLVPWAHPTPGASSPQGYVRPDFAGSAARGTIILFHGNGGWCRDRTPYVEALTRRGFRVFLYEYPGYGGRPGQPSEAAIVPDARNLIRLLDQAGYGPLYVWGESLGSGVAAAVCAEATLPVQGLALLTPWDNLANVALHFYPYLPIRLLMIDQYDSIANLQHFAHPLCVIRCDQDEIIPPPLSLNLYAHLPEPKKMIVQQGYGHNDWPRSPGLTWWDEALDFIAPPQQALVAR